MISIYLFIYLVVLDFVRAKMYVNIIIIKYPKRLWTTIIHTSFISS